MNTPRMRLALLALVLSLLWFGVGGITMLSEEEERVWDTIRTGQHSLWNEQLRRGIELSAEEDKMKTGFIGVEWSPLTTTLGDLEAKRTAANPMWGIQCLRWFDALHLKAGDRIAITSSSSFPALLFSALVAAEARGLDVLLSVSLGSSTWGGNRADFSWPLMAEHLRSSGFIKTKTAFYTLGGSGERGGDFTPELIDALRDLVKKEGAPLLEPTDIKKAIHEKSVKVNGFKPLLVVNIGGSHANMGDDPHILQLSQGLLLPTPQNIQNGGDGVIGKTLQSGTPVLHLLNIKALALEAGIPWDADQFSKIRAGSRLWPSFLGLLIFFVVLIRYKRWEWRDHG